MCKRAGQCRSIPQFFPMVENQNGGRYSVRDMGKYRPESPYNIYGIDRYNICFAIISGAI